jgi:hypothetical protein
MDYSKLSTEDLLALKAGDYSKVSTEGLKSLKGPSEQDQIMSEIRNEPGLISTPTLLTKPSLETEATKIAESPFGQKHPYAAAGLGTALSEGPEVAASLLPISKAGTAAKVIRPLVTGTETLGKELGSTMLEAGLKRAPEVVGEPRTGKAILEFTESLRPLKDKAAKEISQVFDKQGLVQKYDELGRILDHLKVAKTGAQPKQLVAKSTIQELSSLKGKFAQAIKEESPQVGQKMEELSTAYKRNTVLKSLGKKIGIASGTGALGALGYGGYKLGKNLLQ